MVNLDQRASYPNYGPLIESTPGVFFGMASTGGSMNGGAIFKITADAQFSIVSDFPQEQTSPRDIISDQTGEFYYGITQASSPLEGGSIFRVNAAGTLYEQIYDVPTGDIITAMLYTSTGHIWLSGLHDNKNFMFRMRPDGSEFEDIGSYNSSLAGKQNPVTTMVETHDGEIFGATSAIWSEKPIFFKIKNDGTGFAKILDLQGQLSADLVFGSDGNFYIAYGREGIFKLTPSGSISNIFVHPYPNDGPEIKKIIEMNGGRLAAVTELSGSGGVTGARNYGTIFSVEKNGTGYREIYAFLSREFSSPVDMVQSMDGWLYVASSHGGATRNGLVYKLRPDGTSFTKVKEFNGDDGENPNSLFFRRAVQSLTFDPLPDKKTSDPSFLPKIVTTSGSAVNLSSSDPTVAVIENGQIKPVGSGTTMIIATLSANANYYGGGQIERQLVVTKGNQTITFNELPPSSVYDLTVELTAVSTAGLPVTYQSTNPAVASISGSTVTIHTVGSTTIIASQAGNDDFFPAPDVSQVLVIYDGSQSITFSNPGTKVLGDAAFYLTAEASSSLPVEYSTTSDKIIIDESLVTIMKAGFVSIQVNQPGNDDFEPADPVEISFCINPPKPVITDSDEIPDVELHSSNEIGNQWFLDNDVLAGSVSQSIIATEEGSYTVATTIDGCESERSSPKILVTTSIAEVLPKVNLYPNPATQIINVEILGNTSGIARVELLDITGRLLESQEILTGSTCVFDLRKYRNGILLVKIIMDEEIIVRKILAY
jgi:uncharacterized repeat protein (TIGR03803 family)